MLSVALEYLANSGQVETRYQLFWPMIPDAFYPVNCLCFPGNHMVLSWKGPICSCSHRSLLGSKNAVVELRIHCPTRTIMPISPCQFTKTYTWPTRVKYVTLRQNVFHRGIFSQESFKEKIPRSNKFGKHCISYIPLRDS